LVFDAVPSEHLIEEGRRLIEHLQRTGDWRQTRKRRRQPLGLSVDETNFALAVAEGAVRGKTKGQYPAPLAALKAIGEGANRPLDEGLAVERQVAREVVGTETSGNLIGVFFMNNRVSRDPGVDDPNVKPRDVNRVGVLGAGLMGAGIATAHARSGVAVNMVDVNNECIEAGLAKAQKVIADRIQIGRASPQDMADMLAHLSTGTSHDAFADCDVVVEAVPEKEELKTTVYRQLAEHLRDDAILASNTSTISITRMAASAPNPERFAGLHFFYPVDRMQLVEVIRGEKTSDETVATLVALSRRIRKTPIVCKDCPGFLVNRVLLPYMNESLLLALEGATLDQIDKAAERFGMPMGPIALHDLVGLDTACSAGQVMLAAFSDRAVLTPLLKDLVDAGRLGKKSGAGFRKFTGKKGRPDSDPELEPFLKKHRSGSREVSHEEITDRLILPMLLEATRILDEAIVREPAHVDMGLIMGIGFPTFRGGLLKWCDNQGAGNVLKRLERYQSLGKRFEPTEMLVGMAKSGERFYPKVSV
jgi:3-hydroxyacyl-CoA dehydrogenase/enoyl-CoA hydratase/3-hydroxybutyryl-CoA epimerase/3-hydroxyacyl-CoA dehydrogenase/enoyl-CoA hydratase/3-hydroxybutyryl-CoA epimerase/enoyl-CoA isomerase